jgi:hypothetical protein
MDYILTERKYKILSNNYFLFEQYTGFAQIDDEKSITGYDTILNPKGTATYVPKGTKVITIANDQGYEKFIKNKYINQWVSSQRGGKGNEQTDKWIPYKDLFFKIFKKGSVLQFTTPDGKTYVVDWFNPVLDKVKTEQEFYALNSQPEKWEFRQYYDSDTNQPYNPPKTPEKSWIEENWKILAQLGATIVVGFLTAGSSLMVQAAVFLAVDVAFALEQLLVEKDNVGALISLVVGLIPVAGRAVKFGVKAPINFLSKYGKELSQIKDPKTLSLFYNSLKGEEKILMTRILQQTPGEIKNIINQGFLNSFKKAVEKGTIQLEKIPLKQLLWWKQLFIEGGLQLTTGVGLSLMNQIYQLQKMVQQTKEKREKTAKVFEKKTSEEKNKSKENVKKIMNAEVVDDDY